MKTVGIAFKAFDCHELLCHAVASELDLYRAAGLEPRLIDSTFIADEALTPPAFHAACAAALAGFLKGNSLRAVYVACTRPMFWLYGRPGVASLSALEGSRIACFADLTPPTAFLRERLAVAGVHAELLPCRDDVSRLGLLRSGSVKAALISSAYLPHQLEAEGLRPLVFIGRELRLPSTGLAVADGLVADAPELVAAMVKVYRQATEQIFTDDLLLETVLDRNFSIPESQLGEAACVVRACYTRDGRCDMALAQQAVDTMARAMGTASRPAADFYDFRFLDSDA